jgi:hypothetical protein
MSLYNPFKPRIVSLHNRYAVRRLSLFGWLFKSSQLNTWHINEQNVKDYCLKKTVEKAKNLALNTPYEVKFVKAIASTKYIESKE